MAEPGRPPLAGDGPTTTPHRDADRSDTPSRGATRPDARPAPTSRLARLRRARTFESLNDRDFRWFFIATLGLNATMNMQLLARGYLVFELTGSYAALGTMALFLSVVMLGFSLYGGVLADRSSKRVMVQIGELGGRRDRGCRGGPALRRHAALRAPADRGDGAGGDQRPDLPGAAIDAAGDRGHLEAAERRLAQHGRDEQHAAAGGRRSAGSSSHSSARSGSTCS